MSDEKRLAFCENLVAVKEQIVKASYLAGDCRRTTGYGVDGVDLEKAWRSLQGDNEAREGADEALDLIEDNLSMVSANILMAGRDALNDEDLLTEKLTSGCHASPEASRIIAELYVHTGGDFPSVVNGVNALADAGPYSINDTEITPEMKTIVSDLCLVSCRANCQAPIRDDITGEEAAAIIDEVNDRLEEGVLKSDLPKCFDKLQRIDGAISGSRTSVKGIRSHMTRLSLRLWYQKGVSPDCRRPQVARVLCKAANLYQIPASQVIALKWAYHATASLVSVVHQNNTQIDEVLLNLSKDVLGQYTSLSEGIRDEHMTYPAAALYLASGRTLDDFREMVETDFGPVVDYVERNGIEGLVTEPVKPPVKKVGKDSFVHTGTHLSSDVTADADDDDEVTHGLDLFDSVVDDLENGE